MYTFLITLTSTNFDLFSWIINMEGAAGTLYEGERFQLQFKFSNKYPFDSPEVRTLSNIKNSEITGCLICPLIHLKQNMTI